MKESLFIKKVTPFVWFIGRTSAYIIVWIILNNWLGQGNADKALGSLTLNELGGIIFYYIALIGIIGSYIKGFSRYDDTKDMWTSVGWLAIFGMFGLGAYLFNDSQKNQSTIIPTTQNNQINTGWDDPSPVINPNLPANNTTNEASKPQGSIQVTPTSNKKINIVDVYKDNKWGLLGYTLSIPTGNTSTCVWTYAGGSGAVPYSKTTTANINHFLEVDYTSNYYDFKVSCIDDFGNQYEGQFPL